MNRFAVLAEGFEHLSYPLGNTEAEDGQAIPFRKESFVLRLVPSQSHAKSAVGASDFLSKHSSEPVGFVQAGAGGIFLVCRQQGNRAQPQEMSEAERQQFCSNVVERLAALHTAGFGCGGIPAEAVEFSGRGAKLLNPSKIFALDESDSTFYEAVATLRSLAAAGFAKRSEFGRLSALYVSLSPVCRHGVVSHLAEKGFRKQPHAGLAEAAKKALSYF